MEWVRGRPIPLRHKGEGHEHEPGCSHRRPSPGSWGFRHAGLGVVFERETEELKAWWPRQTPPLRVRLIADYVLSLQQ